MTRLWLVSLLVAWASATALSQGVAFEAAAIHENRSLSIDGRFGLVPGRFSVVNLPLRDIIRYAYGVRRPEVVGGPAWLDASKYDISTVYANTNALNGEVRQMLQGLLRERFALRTHRERREIPVYRLVAASRNGSVARGLTRSSTDCDQWRATRADTPPDPRTPRAAPECVTWATLSFIRGFSQPISELTKALEPLVGRPVIDATELTGAFNFDVRWGDRADPGADFSLLSVDLLGALMAALPEQLGLKLDAVRAPHDVVVVDSVQRPTDN